MKTYTKIKLYSISAEPKEEFLAGSVTEKEIQLGSEVETLSFEDKGTFEVSFD